MKWSTAGWLALGIVLLMVANSANFFFHQPFCEVDDWAANSLSIIRAKHFAELYGNYSRWGFHHPGPFFFYVQALGEWLFFDRLHLVAAPFNGQLLIHLAFMAGLFVASLVVFTRWLPDGGRPWFLPLALCLSAAHFSGMANLAPDLGYTLHAPSALASPWSAHALLIPTLCLLAAGASVAAGRGGHLPLLAFADGCLIHLHVAQPLFVLPLTGLAYTGLWWRTRRAPWRAHPRAHLVAAVVAALFAAPIVTDLFYGADSNLAAIVDHLRRHHGEHKTLARSVLYFLQFGTYTEYTLKCNEFGDYDFAGMWVYLRDWSPVYLFWLGTLTVALRPLYMGLRRRRPDDDADDAVGTNRFLAWAGALLLVDLALTLFWGIIQDGAMTYFNAWFNFSLYHFATLTALAALCARWPRLGVSARWRPALLGAGAVAATFALLAGPLRVYDPAPEATATMRRSIREAIADTAPLAGQPPAPRLLVVNPEAWAVTAGVALQMQRDGQPFCIPWRWRIVFGQEYAWDLPPPVCGARWAGRIFRFHSRWHPLIFSPPPVFPLRQGDAMTVMPAAIDPAENEGSVIDFRVGGNAPAYVLAGFGTPERWGSWTTGPRALLAFHPQPAPGGGDVELSTDIRPLILASAGLRAQRLRVFFDGVPLGPTDALAQSDPDWRITVPGALWQAAADRPADVPALLEFDLPDAVTMANNDPQEETSEMLHLGVGVGAMRFRLKSAAPPALASK